MTVTSRNWKTGNLKGDSIHASEQSANIYSDGTYREKNPDWHSQDATGKAVDVMPFIIRILDDCARPVRIADIGAGMGGVSEELNKLLRQKRPDADVQFECFDLSPSAVEEGRRLFPDLNFHCREVGDADGPWDVCLLIDVLEHLENPHAWLRKLRSKCRFVILRQPLQENFSTWRHANYRAQRSQWGHVSFFNERSFRCMAEAAGWEMQDTGLFLAGEYGQSRGTRIPLHRRLIMSLNRDWAAYIFGAYLIGTLKSRELKVP